MLGYGRARVLCVTFLGVSVFCSTGFFLPQLFHLPWRHVPREYKQSGVLQWQ